MRFLRLLGVVLVTAGVLVAMVVCYRAGARADEAARLPLIGDDAPAFVAETTQGMIRFPADYQGKWVVLFSHPADFTPVCTSEFIIFASMQPQFKAINAELVGLSIDGLYSHIAWLRTIRSNLSYQGHKNMDVTFPVIADIKMDVARKYGMIQPNASDTKAVRAVFIIDPKAKVRAVLYYPLTTGRDINEIMRLLIALQTADKHAVSTPANWRPGDDVIVPPPGSCGAAQERMTTPGAGVICQDWFFCLRKLPKDQLVLPPGMR